MSEKKESWLRHPLVSMVLGFIMTGVLGTAITQHFLDQREAEKLRAQIAIDRKYAIQQFSKLNEERKIRAELLVRALRSDSNENGVKTAQQAYEKAYVVWGVERPSTQLLFRDLLSSEDYELIRDKFEESLVEKIYSPITLCLNTSLVHGDDRAAVNDTLEACRMDELLELSSTCSLAIAAGVSDLAETPSGWASTEHMEEQRKQTRDSIREHCP